jgi:hypothetical protein
MCFVRHWMVILLFPPMTIHAVFHVVATFGVLGYIACRSPVFSFGISVMEYVGFAPEVLPVMSIHAVCLVVIFSEGAPFGFEVKHMEVGVFGHLVNELNFDL